MNAVAWFAAGALAGLFILFGSLSIFAVLLARRVESARREEMMRKAERRPQ